MKRPGHPSNRKLEAWVRGESQAIDDHLADCAHCADRLEGLSAHEDEPIRAALLELLSVPSEVPERLQASLDERLNNHQDLLLVAEFFGLPFRIVRVFTSNDQGDD